MKWCDEYKTEPSFTVLTGLTLCLISNKWFENTNISLKQIQVENIHTNYKFNNKTRSVAIRNDSKIVVIDLKGFSKFSYIDNIS